MTITKTLFDNFSQFVLYIKNLIVNLYLDTKTKVKTMEIKFRNSEVFPLLQKVAKAVSPKPMIPILSNILLHIDSAGVLVMTGGDSEIWLSAQCQLFNEGSESLDICVNTQDLLKVLGNLGDCEVAFDIDTDSNRIKVKYPTGNMVIPMMKADEYPKIKTDGDEYPTSFHIDAQRLISLVSGVGFCTGADEIRPVMQAVFMDFSKDDALSVCATDGHRLAMVKTEPVTFEGEAVQNLKLTQKTVSNIPSLFGRHIGDVIVKCNEKSVCIESEGETVRLVSRQIEGNYPNYMAVIPSSSAINVSINRKALEGALKRVTALNDVSGLTVLKLKYNALEISAQDIDYGRSVSESVACEYDGNDLTIGFKGELLMQFVSMLDGEDIVLRMNDCARPGVLVPSHQSEGFKILYLLMPMMLVD